MVKIETIAIIGGGLLLASTLLAPKQVGKAIVGVGTGVVGGFFEAGQELGEKTAEGLLSILPVTPLDPFVILGEQNPEFLGDIGTGSFVRLNNNERGTILDTASRLSPFNEIAFENFTLKRSQFITYRDIKSVINFVGA